MDRFTELMQDLGIYVGGVLNPGQVTPSPDVIQPQQPPAVAGIATTPSPDVMQPPPPQGWMPQPVPFPNTQSGPPTLAPTPMPGYDPTGASPPPTPAQPRSVGSNLASIAPSASLQMPPPMVSGYDPTGPSAALQTAIDLGLIQPDPGISTQQMSGYPPQAGPEPSRQGEYGPAASRGTTGSREAPGPAANGAPSSAGPAPSVSGTGPAAPPPSPQAKVQDALTPKGDRFGITPRTYQLMGVIGATLMMGARPGESPMAAMGRAVGAGMMYDNFARLSDQEASSNERVLAIREKQLGLEGTKVGQQGKLTEARITQINADIAKDRELLKHAQSREERDALQDRIKTNMALIGLRYAEPMAEAELAGKRGQVEGPEIKRGRLMLDLMKESKNIDGTTNWPDVMQKMRTVPGLGFKSAPAQLLAVGRRDLAAIKDPKQQAAERERMNQALISKGFVPEI